MSDRICGAKNRRGLPCSRAPSPGSKRCHYHGGAQARIPRGDPRRGGRKHGAGLYRRWLNEREREVYDTCPIGNLDHEIKLMRSKLDDIIRHHGEDRLGGIVTERRTVMVAGEPVELRKFEPWISLAGRFVDELRKLEETRRKLLADPEPDDDELRGYEEWLKEARSHSGSS